MAVPSNLSPFTVSVNAGLDATANGGERLRLTLRTHLETPSERFARARPELVLRYRASRSRVQELTRIRALREGYDRVEIP